MNRQEFRKAYAMATDIRVRLDIVNLTAPFNGFGLRDFAPVHVTVQQIAALIRWQCGNIFGQTEMIDQAALEEIISHGRKKFMVIN